MKSLTLFLVSIVLVAVFQKMQEDKLVLEQNSRIARLVAERDAAGLVRMQEFVAGVTSTLSALSDMAHEERADSDGKYSLQYSEIDALDLFTRAIKYRNSQFTNLPAMPLPFVEEPTNSFPGRPIFSIRW